MKGRLEEVTAARLELLPARVGAVTPQMVLQRDAPGLEAPDHRSANRSCRLLEACDGWIALNLARPEDVELASVMCGRDARDGQTDHWEAVAGLARTSAASDFVSRAVEFQLPVAALAEAPSCPLDAWKRAAAPRRVLDLSALWAGPLCAGLLARAGAHVTRVESVRRRDPTPDTAPRLDHFLNGAKTRLALDLTDAIDRTRLRDAVMDADVLVTSARLPALARLGLEPDILLASHPRLIWAAITAHGSTGSGAMRVGFGDDCAVAGGLVRREAGAPRFLGDALADPLTGLEAALAVLDWTGESRGGFIDMSMARVAAAYAQAAS